MNKFKSALRAVGGFVMLAYLFVAMAIMVPYYNYQFARDHGFLSWFLLGEIVPTAKALVWPYFVFFADRQGKRPPQLGRAESPEKTGPQRPPMNASELETYSRALARTFFCFPDGNRQWGPYEGRKSSRRFRRRGKRALWVPCKPENV